MKKIAGLKFMDEFTFDYYKTRTIKSYNSQVAYHSKKFKDAFDLSRRPEFPRFVDELSGTKVLDLGCGSGDHALYFKGQGLDVTCIDLSEEMIELCLTKGLDAMVMDIEDLDFLNESFDGVWAVASLLHIPKQKLDGVTGAIYRILKPQGKLYVCVYEGQCQRFVEDESLPRFFNFFTYEELLGYFCDRFEVLKSERVNVNNKVFLQFLFKKANPLV